MNKSKSLFYQVKLLYLLATLYFQRKEFVESSKYCDKLLSITENSRGHSMKVTEFKTIVLKSLVENYSGNNDEAITILKDYLKTKKIVSTKNKFDSWCVLTLFYFHKKDFKLAKATFNQLQETDSYYTELMGKEWVMRKNLIEILLYIELEEYDFVDGKLKSFLRINKVYLEGQKRVRIFLLLVKRMYNNPTTINANFLKQKLQTTLEKKPRKREDIFVLSFFAWLKAKIEEKDLYEVTLELVHSLENEEK